MHHESLISTAPYQGYTQCHFMLIKTMTTGPAFERPLLLCVGGEHTMNTTSTRPWSRAIRRQYNLQAKHALHHIRTPGSWTHANGDRPWRSGMLATLLMSVARLQVSNAMETLLIPYPAMSKELYITSSACRTSLCRYRMESRGPK